MDLWSIKRAFQDSPLYQEIAHRVEQGNAPDSDAKRHHLAPQFLLRNFATGEGKSASLFQLDKRTGKPQRVSVETAASRHRFYALRDEEGQRHNRVEAYLALVEGHAAPAVAEYLNDPEALRAPDAATISHHLALQIARTPTNIRRAAHAADTMMRLLMSNHVADPAAFAAQYAELFGDSDPARAEDLRQRMLSGLRDGSIAFPDMRELGLYYGLQAAGEAAQEVFQMPWTLMLATDGQFITSDTGLAMFDPQPRHPWTGNSIRSSEHAQTTIPLAPRACLLLTAEEPSGNRSVQEIGADDVDEINLRTYGWADRHIFGASQEIVSNVRALAKRSWGRVPTPRPWRQVLLFEASAGDDELAQEHIRRGWPARFHADGGAHDYIVVDEEEHPVERGLRAHELVKDRARARRRVTGTDKLVEAGIEAAPLADALATSAEAEDMSSSGTPGLGPGPKPPAKRRRRPKSRKRPRR